MKDISKFSDEKIVEIVRTGDKQMFAQIIKRYQDKLLRYAQYLVKDESDAADVVQGSFIKTYINLNGFNTKKKFTSWIYRIVHNEAMNFVNKNKKYVPMYEGADFDSGIDLQEDMIKKELRSKTRECLSKMDIRYSEPLTLYYLEERSYEEIGDILRIPIATVGTRINRAKSIMKKICKT